MNRAEQQKLSEIILQELTSRTRYETNLDMADKIRRRLLHECNIDFVKANNIKYGS